MSRGTGHKKRPKHEDRTEDSSISSILSDETIISVSTGATSVSSSRSSISDDSDGSSRSTLHKQKSEVETLFLSGRDADTTSAVSFAGSHTRGIDAFADLLHDCCGDAGRWQIKLFLLTSFCGFLVALHNLSYAFIAATPNYWCTLPSFPGLTLEQIKKEALPLDKKGNYSRCERYKVVREGTNKTAAILDKSKKVSCSGYVYDHSEFESTMVTEWDLVCERAHLAATVQAIYMIGILVGSPLFGFLSDLVGRRWTIIVATGMFAIFSPVVALVPTYNILLFARFLQGMATPGLYSTSYILAVEGIGISWRGTAGNLFCLPFAFGFMALAGFGYYINDWRTLQLAISAPIIIQIIICVFIPESPRWLIRRGRVAEAEKVLREVARVNHRLKCIPPNFTQRLWAFALQEKIIEVKEKTTCKQKVIAGLKYPFQLCRTPKLRVRTLILYFCWLAVSMVYYGVALNAPNLSTNRYMYMFLAGILEVPSYLMVPPLIRYLGRRPTFVGFCLCCGASLLLSLVFKPGTTGLVAFALMGKILIGAAYALIYLYATELLPTQLRASGVGGACMAGHIGSAISPYIVDHVGEHNRMFPAIVFGSIAIAAGVLALFLAETRNVKLPETVSDVERPKPKTEVKIEQENRKVKRTAALEKLIKPDVYKSLSKPQIEKPILKPTVAENPPSNPKTIGKK